MYNLYTFEKNKLIKEKNEYQDKKSKKLMFKRKLELDKLSSNYNKRMNNFIINLCEHPIFIKDNSNKNIELRLTNKKIYKNLSSAGLMTDKNRINLLRKKNNLNLENEMKLTPKKNRHEDNKVNKHKEKNLFVQPKMRFKPRSELERIIEVMNLLSSNKRTKKVKKILEKLKQTDYNIIKRSKEYGKLKQIYKHKIKEIYKNKDKTNDKNNSSIKDEADEDLDFTLENNLYRKIRNISNQLNKQIKLRNERLKYTDTGETIKEGNILRNLKSRNKELLEIFKDDEKTYFKGASQYSMIYNNKRDNKYKNSHLLRLKSEYSFFNSTKNINNYYSTNNFNFLRHKNSKALIKSQRPMSMYTINLKKNNNKESINKQKNYYEEKSFKKLGIQFQNKKRNMNNIINEEIKKSLLNQFYSKLDKKEFSQYFHKPFFLDKNAILVQKVKTIDIDLDNKLKYLRNVISLNNDSNNSIILQNNGNSGCNTTKNKKIHNAIIIDGKKYSIDDIKNISNAIFTKCGYYNKKIIK